MSIRMHACSALLAAASLTLGTTVSGAGQQGRLSIEVDVQGQEAAQGQGDWSKTRIAQHYRIVTMVQSDGVLSSVNGKDPDYAKKSVADGERARQKIRAVQARNAAAGIGPKPVSPQAAQTLMQQMQAEVARCGGDNACRQRVGMQFMSRPDFSAAMTAMSTPEFICQQHSGGDAQRQRDCLRAQGVSDAPAPVDPDEPEAPVDERFLLFIGFDTCASALSFVIDDRLEGAYADVNGMIPFVVTHKADWHGTPTDRRLYCVYNDLVYDTKAKTIYTNGMPMPEIRGSTVRSERGRGEQRAEGGLPVPPAVSKFVFDTLRVAPASGSRRGTVTFDGPYLSPPPIQQYNGSATVQMSWKFEPL